MRRVVVVDEDPQVRASAAAILHDLACEVETVADVQRELRRRRRTPPDAYLVGERSASEFVHARHETPRFEHVPIVVMAVTPRAAIDAIREGARACIRKPVNTGSVFAALSDVLVRSPRAARGR